MLKYLGVDGCSSNVYWASISKHKGDSSQKGRKYPWPYGTYILMEANKPLIGKQINEKIKIIEEKINQTG